MIGKRRKRQERCGCGCCGGGCRRRPPGFGCRRFSSRFFASKPVSAIVLTVAAVIAVVGRTKISFGVVSSLTSSSFASPRLGARRPPGPANRRFDAKMTNSRQLNRCLLSNSLRTEEQRKDDDGSNIIKDKTTTGTSNNKNAEPSKLSKKRAASDADYDGRTSFINGISRRETTNPPRDPLPVHHSVQTRAGLLCNDADCLEDDWTHTVPHRGRGRKRVLVLCTGGTLTMENDPSQGNSLAPVQGALTRYLDRMPELTNDPEMPEIVAHEYTPLIDSSDMGPGDWKILAEDIATNYAYFDGFVVLMGTDTMCVVRTIVGFLQCSCAVNAHLSVAPRAYFEILTHPPIRQ